MNNKKHYAAAISAFIIWGFFPILLRALQQYPSGEILYFRILVSFLILIIVIFGFKRKQLREDLILYKSFTRERRIKVLGLTLLGGVLLTGNWLAFIYIVNSINIKTASFSYLICPVVTAILGYVILKEKMTLLQWIAVALCALSCVLMGMNSLYELGFSFFTAFTYALYLISQRKNQGFDRLIILGIQVLFSFLILNILYAYLVKEVPGDPYFYILILIIAIVFTVLPLFLNLFALNRINSATIGILMYINPLFNFSIAFLVFDETINTIQVIGYSIILMALLLFNFSNIKMMYTQLGDNARLS